MKRCSVCKQVWYCGAECQNAAWKKHKKTCAPPLPAKIVWQKINAADSASDWREVLKWEGRMEELMLGQSAALQESILESFSRAHEGGLAATARDDHRVSVVRLFEQRIELLGNMERFRDQGACLCSLAGSKLGQGKETEGEKCYKRARDIGAAHGFFLLECRSCQGLGRIAMRQGRHEEAVQLFQNALAAAPLCEGSEADCVMDELAALRYLIDALFETNSVDEVEPLVERYRSLFKLEWEERIRGTHFELHSLYVSARLHEVLCFSIPFGETPCGGAALAFYHGRYHHVMEPTTLD